MYDPSSIPVRASSSVLQVLGLICTAWRIYFRLKIHRFWWEDAWAAVVLLSCIASLVGEWTYLLTYDLTSNVGYWFHTLGFTCVIRATHLSIVFSIVRIVRENRLRTFTYICAASCGAVWIALVSQKIWNCASDPRWHHYKTPTCVVERQILIFEIASNCVTVGILITIPLCVLWRVKLPRRQRRMILCIFASSVVLAFVAILHIVGRILNIPIILVAGVDYQVACSIIVCNLLVVVTYAYRFLGCDGASPEPPTAVSETDSDDFTQPTGHSTDSSMQMTQQFTTQISVQSYSVFTESVYA